LHCSEVQLSADALAFGMPELPDIERQWLYVVSA
jgi:hypothetical protein